MCNFALYRSFIAQRKRAIRAQEKIRGFALLTLPFLSGAIINHTFEFATGLSGVGVNFSAKSNMYSVARDTVLDRYARHVELAGGSADAFTPLFCVVSQTPLGENAKKALASSAQALGYGAQGCFFVIIAPHGCDALNAKQLFSLIEGIDPLALVAADKDATRALEQAYRVAQEAIYRGQDAKEPHRFQLSPNAYTRILGRDAVTFSSFEAMLAKPDLKQKAWALLKKLPKRA